MAAAQTPTSRTTATMPPMAATGSAGSQPAARMVGRSDESRSTLNEAWIASVPLNRVSQSRFSITLWPRAIAHAHG